MKKSFSIEEVKAACKSAMVRLKEDLPDSVSSRLKPQRVVHRHGTDTRIYIFHIWDKHQPSLLDYKHFSYGIVFDPVLRYHKKPLWARFYVNRHRIYDKSKEVISALWEEMEMAEKELFDYEAWQNEQMIGLFRELRAESVAEFEESIYQAFLELMPYWHSRYASVIDNYGRKLTKKEVKDVISGRKKFQPSHGNFIESNPAYSRHIPHNLRTFIVQRDDNCCLKCGETTDLHVDHILPVSLGGLTIEDNLQTLCSDCNLSKGNRDKIDYRKAKKK